jgi:hypothetical protein
VDVDPAPPPSPWSSGVRTEVRELAIAVASGSFTCGRLEAGAGVGSLGAGEAGGAAVPDGAVSGPAAPDAAGSVAAGAVAPPAGGGADGRTVFTRLLTIGTLTLPTTGRERTTDPRLDSLGDVWRGAGTFEVEAEPAEVPEVCDPLPEVLEGTPPAGCEPAPVIDPTPPPAALPAAVEAEVASAAVAPAARASAAADAAAAVAAASPEAAFPRSACAGATGDEIEDGSDAAIEMRAGSMVPIEGPRTVVSVSAGAPASGGAAVSGPGE